MNTLFDYIFEVTPSIELLAKNLWIAYGGERNGFGFIHNKEPIKYSIAYDIYTNTEYFKNKYNWGLIVTRRDNSKVFLYYREDKHFLPNGICLNYFDI